MAAYTWPPTLPQEPLSNGYGETSGINVVRTPTDAGPAKMRRRSARPDVITVQFLMDTAQIATLDNFVKSSLLGIRRFNFTHPRTNAAIEVRIVPSGDGEFYSISNVSDIYWTVSMTLEVMP